MTAKEAIEILEGELESLSSARGSDYSGVLALKHAISVLQELPDEQAVRPNIRQEMAQKCRNDAWRQQVVSAVAESMSKVISGINSIEICKQIVSDNLRNWCERTQCKLRIAMNYLPYQGKALPSAQPEQRWIPCSERLPEDDEIVLVSDGIDYAVAFWRSDAHAWDDPIYGWLDSFGFNVRAWMPLPEPYTERREE